MTAEMTAARQRRRLISIVEGEQRSYGVRVTGRPMRVFYAGYPKTPWWSAACDLCLFARSGSTHAEVLAGALRHLRVEHGCPSRRASGEPCTEWCEDCGGLGWVA